MSHPPKYNFFLKFPFYNHTTKPIEIKNAEGLTVGNVKRVYNGFFDRIVDGVLQLANKRNFKIELEKNDYYFSASYVKYKESLWGDKWDIYINDFQVEKGIGRITNQSKVSTNPRFEYSKDDKSYSIKKDFFDKNIYIEDDNQQIAKVYHENITSMRSMYIDIQNNSALYDDELLLVIFIFLSNTD